MPVDKLLIVVFSLTRNIINASELIQVDIATRYRTSVRILDLFGVVSKADFIIRKRNPWLNNSPIIRLFLLSALLGLSRDANAILIELVLISLAAGRCDNRRRLRSNFSF